MNKKLPVLLLLIFISYSAVFGQEITVASADNLDLSKYKTFMWDPQVNNETEEGGIYFLDDLVVKSQLRDALRNELTGSGYTFDKTNADLAVHFILFDEVSLINGYKSLPENLISYQPEPGTLIISLTDFKEGNVIWQASAEGLSKEEILKDESILRDVVAEIFQKSTLSKK